MKAKKATQQIDEPRRTSSTTSQEVGNGASTGGLDAFKKLLKAIPDNSGISYELMQHLSVTSESLLPDLLQKITNIPVLKITDDINVEPDHVYIIPSNKKLTFNDGAVVQERNYAETIVATVREPLIVLDKNLRLKTANKSFYKTFQINEQEAEGKRIYDLGNNQWDIPQFRILLESVLPEKESISDLEVSHSFQSIGQCTMLLNARILKDNTGEKLILLAIEVITKNRKEEEENAVLSALVYSSEDIIISKTLDGIITSWNKGSEKILGYSRKEVVGKHVTFIIPPELHQEEEMIAEKIKKGEPVLHFDTIRLAKDGRRINMSLTVSPIKDKNGKIIGASAIARDTTERTQAEEILRNDEATFRRLVKNLPAGVYSVDAEGCINFYNEAAVKVWGREPELGKEQWCGSHKMITLDGVPLPADACPMAIAFKEGRAIMGEEIIVQRADGGRSIVQVYPQPI